MRWWHHQRPCLRDRGRLLASAVLLALVLTPAGRADEAPVATIAVSSSTSGSSLAGRLVEGVMSFRGQDYLLTLRGVAESVDTVGSVRGLLRPSDIEGAFVPRHPRKIFTKQELGEWIIECCTAGFAGQIGGKGIIRLVEREQDIASIELGGGP